MTPTSIKAGGYAVSILSVFLLGAVAWDSASENPVLLVCLIAGIATSIIGMLLRMTAHIVDKEKS